MGALIPQPHGGALRNGGTNKGGTGRPPKAFKDFLAELRTNPKVQEAIRAAAEDADSKNFKAALDVIVRYDIEKPAEQIDVNLSEEAREQRVLTLLQQAKKRREREMVS